MHLEPARFLARVAGLSMSAALGRKRCPSGVSDGHQSKAYISAFASGLSLVQPRVLQPLPDYGGDLNDVLIRHWIVRIPLQADVREMQNRHIATMIVDCLRKQPVPFDQEPPVFQRPEVGRVRLCSEGEVDCLADRCARQS